jgi:hypothetical protein
MTEEIDYRQSPSQNNPVDNISGHWAAHDMKELPLGLQF